MATIPTLSYLQSDENIIQQLITRPLPVDADLFDVADNCAALVTVLVESDDSVISSALCEPCCKRFIDCVNSAIPISRRTLLNS